MKLMKNKAITIIVICLISFLMIMTSVCPTYVRADDSAVNFDKTNVLDDLKSSNDFDILEYPYFPLNNEIKIINFVEYCYTVKINKQDDYGLYVYLYNPSGKNIDTTGSANTIQMAVSYDDDGVPNDYEKFGLKFCSKSEESNYKNLFYKFKVVDKKINGKTFIDRVNSNQRRYDVSGIEILDEGKNLPTDYGVGGTYLFTGYAKGYGIDVSAESTLTCEVNDLETVKLDVHSTYYRTGEYTTNLKHDLTSVYFAVPNRFFEEYGKLQKIKAEWYEYETTPVCITSNSTVYDLLYPYLGKLTNESTDNPLELYNGYREEVGSNGHYDHYSWAYNCDYAVVDESCKRISYLFSTEGKSISDYVLSSERLKTYTETYDKSFADGYIDVPGKNISHDLFEKTLSADRTEINYVDDDIHHKLVEFDADNTFDMLNFDDSFSGWQKFFLRLFGFAPNSDDNSYKDISPIYVVTPDDMKRDNLSSTLLIDGSDEALREFKSFYNESVSDDKTVVLFRFAQTDYMNLPVMAYNGSTGKRLSANEGTDTYIVQESIFFNFDILYLTFNKVGKYTVIPVVSSPIDIYNDITLPSSGFDLLKLIIGLILLIILLVILNSTGILPLIVKIIVWVISAPFKFIKWLIDKFRSD